MGENLSRVDLRIIDLRPQPAYNGGYIPGSVRMDVEHFRGAVGGVSSMLLPADIIARHLGLLERPHQLQSPTRQRRRARGPDHRI